MMNRKLLEKVQQAAHFKNDNDVKVFEEGVWKLAEKQDGGTFQKLIELFDDKTKYPEVMFNLVHALESYPDEKYVILIINGINFLTSAYKEWYARLVMRILNEEHCKKIFIKQFNQLDASFRRKITEIIRDQYPEKLYLLGKINNNQE